MAEKAGTKHGHGCLQWCPPQPWLHPGHGLVPWASLPGIGSACRPGAAGCIRAQWAMLPARLNSGMASTPRTGSTASASASTYLIQR